MSRASIYLKEIKASGTNVTNILILIKDALKRDVNPKISKSNFTSKGAEWVFEYKDKNKYRITIEPILKK